MYKTGGSGNWKIIDELLSSALIPRFVKVQQFFPHPPPVDVALEIVTGIQKKKLPIKKGARIAITVGSRGISNQPLAVKTIGESLRSLGAEPFMVPAMGSHAGATAEGQAAMLRDMGFSEEKMGMPIVSSMEVVELGKTKSGLPVYIDKNAYEADGIVIINRIKSHVSFHGAYESGLMKMITIGLGKQRGADFAHNLGFGSMPGNVPEIALESLKHGKFLLAIGLLENAFHETSKVVVLDPSEIEAEEPKLLLEAKELCGKLHFDTIDTLIIDEIGKHISGSGFDTNVVGRYHSSFISGGPKINRVLILDISDKSKGNGLGLGIADFSTIRALEKFDFSQTYPNVLTSTLTGGGKVPVILANDRQAIRACIKTSNLDNWSESRIVRIKNTLSLTEIEVSENMLPDLKNDSRFKIISEPYELAFNEQGNLF